MIYAVAVYKLSVTLTNKEAGNVVLQLSKWKRRIYLIIIDFKTTEYIDKTVNLFMTFDNIGQTNK